MKKAIYTPPHLEELKVDDMKLLAGSNNSASAGGTQGGEGNNDPFGARETQFNEFEE
ncbi:MAG: hypothetical protein J6O23_01360 [Prevotella sp.]|nr:hypothetical protein [Prevotella sp.]